MFLDFLLNLVGVNRSRILIFGPKAGELSVAVSALLSGKPLEGWEWVSSSRNSVVARCMEPSAYYKEYLKRSPFEGIKALFRGSRCRRAREQGELLAQKGFHTPEILCWGSSGNRQFMVTRGVDGIGFYDFMIAHWKRPLTKESLRTKRRIIGELAREIGRLHREGIFYGDLRPNNILVVKDTDKVSFHFIDYERNHRFSRLPVRHVKKNLVQIGMIYPDMVTVQDRMRFFRAYCAEYGRFSTEEAKNLAAAVHRRTLERLWP